MFFHFVALTATATATAEDNKSNGDVGVFLAIPNQNGHHKATTMISPCSSVHSRLSASDSGMLLPCMIWSRCLQWLHILYLQLYNRPEEHGGHCNFRVEKCLETEHMGKISISNTLIKTSGKKETTNRACNVHVVNFSNYKARNNFPAFPNF